MKRLSPFILENSYLKNVIILGLFLLCCQNASVSLPPCPLWLSLSENKMMDLQQKKKNLISLKGMLIIYCYCFQLIPYISQHSQRQITYVKFQYQGYISSKFLKFF